MLEGTWITEDGLQKYEFVANEDKSGMNCCTMWWNNETEEWYSWSIFAESAFRDHTAADMRILYDSEENVIKDTDTIYHKQ